MHSAGQRKRCWLIFRHGPAKSNVAQVATLSQWESLALDCVPCRPCSANLDNLITTPRASSSCANLLPGNDFNRGRPAKSSILDNRAGAEATFSNALTAKFLQQNVVILMIVLITTRGY
jgi:hypothetical protein